MEETVCDERGVTSGVRRVSLGSKGTDTQTYRSARSKITDHDSIHEWREGQRLSGGFLPPLHKT